MDSNYQITKMAEEYNQMSKFFSKKLKQIPPNSWNHAFKETPREKIDGYRVWSERHILSAEFGKFRVTIERKTCHDPLSTPSYPFEAFPGISYTEYVARFIQNGKIKRVEEGGENSELRDTYETLLHHFLEQEQNKKS